MHDRIETFLSGNDKAIFFGSENTAGNFLLPGSFNPLHDGHRRMAGYVQEHYGAKPVFEISVTNVDKPALTLEQIHQRLTQFDAKSVWLTKATTFAEKAKLFPGTTFIVGADTVTRLFDIQYYRDEADYEQSLQTLDENVCRFLAFGRLMDETFHESSSVSIPGAAQRWFDFVPETRFRCDLSSTEIRRNNST